MKKAIGTQFAICFALCTSANAAVIYTSEAVFNAATTGQVVTTFEENGFGGFNSYGSPGTYTGTNFSISSNSSLLTVDPGYHNAYDWGTGDVLDFEYGIGTITVDPSVSAFGFKFGNPSEATFSGVITINGVDYPILGQPTFNFFGIVGTGPLGPVSINFNAGLGIIDDFVIANASNAVPEPSSLILLGMGGVGMAIGAYRRRRAGVVA